MVQILKTLIKNIDWILVLGILPLLLAGLVTMNSFVGENTLFFRQVIWIFGAFVLFFGLSFIDFRFLRRTEILVSLFLTAIVVLIALLFFGSTIQGAKSWINFGFFSFQPSDPLKIVLILVLAKYFSRRHIEIAHFKHILVSGLYAFVPFVLIFLQPDLGSAIIIFLIWLGMILVSGVSKKHLAIVFGLGVLSFALLWGFALQDYQKDRVSAFLDPYSEQGTMHINLWLQ